MYAHWGPNVGVFLGTIGTGMGGVFNVMGLERHEIRIGAHVTFLIPEDYIPILSGVEAHYVYNVAKHFRTVVGLRLFAYPTAVLATFGFHL